MSQNATAGVKVAVTFTGATVSVVGPSVGAINAATIIAATGGAAALVLVGYGLYRWLSKNQPSGQLSGGTRPDQLPGGEKDLLE